MKVKVNIFFISACNKVIDQINPDGQNYIETEMQVEHLPRIGEWMKFQSTNNEYELFHYKVYDLDRNYVDFNLVDVNIYLDDE